MAWLVKNPSLSALAEGAPEKNTTKFKSCFPLPKGYSRNLRCPPVQTYLNRQPLLTDNCYTMLLGITEQLEFSGAPGAAAGLSRDRPLETPCTEDPVLPLSSRIGRERPGPAPWWPGPPGTCISDRSLRGQCTHHSLRGRHRRLPSYARYLPCC